MRLPVLFMCFAFLLSAVPAVFAGEAPAKAAVDMTAFYKPGMGPYKDISKFDGQLNMPGRRTALQYRATFSRSAQNMPVIVWSHGAFGSHTAYVPLAEYWASHGYLVLQPTHSDSMREGTKPNVKNPLVFKDWDDRPREVSYLIDQLQNLQTLIPAIKGRVDAGKIGIGGHSFGAHTAQLLAGMQVKRFMGGGERYDFLEKRAQAFVIVSPQGTSNQIDAAALAKMDAPFLMITGTNDNAANNGKDYIWRLEAWNHAPAGPNRYLLLMQGAHHGFGGISGAVRFSGAGPADAAEVEAVRSSALALFDAKVRGDAAAEMWLLDGEISRATKDGTRFTWLSKQ